MKLKKLVKYAKKKYGKGWVAVDKNKNFIGILQSQ